ncbi:beta-ketoacyl-[acyl-carrier-protein] synthase family protein [Xylanibacillus composti]|nr:beta-ketoacyl-[acyl-carrier-protein] synthase family protein [Xylanibacillus composti]
MSEVVISGIGVNASIGQGADRCWEGLLTGRTGIGKVRSFDVSGHRNQFACEIQALPRSATYPDKVAAMGRTTQIVVPAVEEALQDAQITMDDCKRLRVGLCVGTTMGEIEPLEQTLHTAPSAKLGGPRAIADNLRQLLPLAGPVWTFTNACAAGNFAIARCMDELRAGRADLMIAAGVDALSWIAFTGFSSLRAMSPGRCRPFDQERQGLILGEGAGVLVLETKAQAAERQARARASLLGYGFNGDAHHITQPDPEAKGAIRAMRTAMAMAGIRPAQIDYVSAHGTGTAANDAMEARAISTVFEDSHVQVSSIKGHLGHTLGAASAIEAIMCVKALETGIRPPTLHLEQVDPACQEANIEYIRSPGTGSAAYIMSNSYAFGGINSSIILGKQ